MARVSPLTPSFGAGELSPWLEGRSDFEAYPKGLRICENFMPLVQGPATKRPGTRFVASVQVATNKSILVPFIFSDEQAYVLEFGAGYIRFYTNQSQVLSGGEPYAVSTPYAAGDLPLLRFTQSADILYIAHPRQAPRKLSRFAPTNWTLDLVPFKNGPIGPENVDVGITAYSSADTGSVTVTASAAIFNANMIGSFFRLRQQDLGDVLPWEPGKVVVASDLRRYSGNVYKAVGGGTTGGDPPIHTEGRAIDGSAGVTWTYMNSGFGIVRITGYTSPTVVTGAVSLRLPAGVVGSANATTRWAHGEWSSDKGFPGAVSFYGDRLYWGGSTTKPQTVWGSVVGDYENHQSGTRDDSALALTLNSSDVNLIRWMAGDEKGLLVGTIGGEWVIRAGNQSEAMTPFNAQALRVSDYGSNEVRPTRVGKAILFVQRAARKLREFAYLIDVDGFKAPDMTVRAEHISKSGFYDLAFQAQPSNIVWSPRVDGVLAGFTYERDQEVTAWHRHILGGFSDAGQTSPAVVESVAAIPSPDGSQDDLWMIVRRHINGGLQRYVEFMTPVFDHETPQPNAFFVDCGRTYFGAPVTIVSGLTHLEGQTVSILADGAVHPDRVVVAGEVALDRAASVVHVGLKYTARLQTERPSAGAGDGTAQGKPKRIAEMIVRLYRTGNLKYGSSFEQMDQLELRSSSDPMGSAAALFSGDKRFAWPGGWETDGCACFVSDTPTPATILSLTPVMEVTSPR